MENDILPLIELSSIVGHRISIQPTKADCGMGEILTSKLPYIV
jgi:hypothetical protein